jgi:pyridoxine kinase
LAEGIFANVGYDRISEAFWCVPFNNVSASYPGTGDLFASVLTGSLLSGDSLPMAMSRAARFVEDSIKTTFGFNGQPREGVMFERLLDKLVGHETHLDYQVL